MSDAHRAYDRAARALHATELRIASIEHRDAGGVDANILPSLIAKRARLTDELIALKPAAEAERVDRFTARHGSHITFPDQTWHPIGTIRLDDRDAGIPDCLRRVRA